MGEIWTIVWNWLCFLCDKYYDNYTIERNIEKGFFERIERKIRLKRAAKGQTETTFYFRAKNGFVFQNICLCWFQLVEKQFEEVLF